MEVLHHSLAVTSLSNSDSVCFLFQDSAPAVTEAAGSGSWESLQTLQNGFHTDRDLPNGMSIISIFRYWPCFPRQLCQLPVPALFPAVHFCGQLRLLSTFVLRVTGTRPVSYTQQQCQLFMQQHENNSCVFTISFFGQNSTLFTFHQLLDVQQKKSSMSFHHKGQIFLLLSW